MTAKQIREDYPNAIQEFANRGATLVFRPADQKFIVTKRDRSRLYFTIAQMDDYETTLRGQTGNTLKAVPKPKSTNSIRIP